MRERNNILYLDVARDIAIFLVIALHTVSPVIIANEILGTKTWWICCVINILGRMGVPTFFMVSGYLLLSSPKTGEAPLAFYKHRLQRLLIPFLFWDVVYYLFRCFLEKQAVDPLQFFQELMNQGSKVHLWFVYQIVAIYLITPFLKKIVDHSNRNELWLFLFVILLVPTVFRLLNVVQSVILIAPFNAPIDGYVGFFLLGYLLGSGTFSRRQRRGLYLSAALAGVIAVTGNYVLSSPDKMSFVFNEGYCFVHFVTSAALFLAVRELSGYLGPRLASFAHGFSGLTYGIYLSHFFFLTSFELLFTNRGIPFNSPVRILITFVLTSVCASFLVYIMSRVPVLRRLVI